MIEKTRHGSFGLRKMRPSAHSSAMTSERIRCVAFQSRRIRRTDRAGKRFGWMVGALCLVMVACGGDVSVGQQRRTGEAGATAAKSPSLPATGEAVTTKAASPNPTCTGGGVGTWESIPLDVGAPAANYALAYGSSLVIVGWSTTVRYVASYNPAQRTWRTYPISATAPRPRSVPFVGIVGERLYIYGGVDNPSEIAVPLTDGAFLDLSSGVWTTLPAAGAPSLVSNGGGTVNLQVFGASGKVVLLAGGNGADGVVHPSLGIFDPTAGSWSSRNDATFLEFSHCSTQGGFALAEGTSACVSWSTVALVTASGYQEIPSANVPRTYTFPAWVTGGLFVWFSSFPAVPTIPQPVAKRYRQPENVWEDIPVPAAIPTDADIVAALNGNALVLGASPQNGKFGALYNPVLKTWQPAASCALAKASPFSATVSGRVYFLIDQKRITAFAL